MTNLYSLTEFKSKASLHVHKNKSQYDNQHKIILDYVKSELSIRNLVERNINFLYKESGNLAKLTEENVDNFIKEFKKNGIDDAHAIKDNLNYIEMEQQNITPIAFNNFDEFIQHKKNEKKDHSINKFIKKKNKEQKAQKKEQKQQNTAKNIIKEITPESAFLSIDFECFFYENNKPLEVGTCSFKANDEKKELRGNHLIFKENEHLLKKQPKKFQKQHGFEHGETYTKSQENIRKSLQEKVNEADFIVCHAAQLEKKMMKALGVDFSNKKVIDSQIIYKNLNQDKQVSSIEKIAHSHDKDKDTLHNSGNDAVFTAEYFLNLIQNQNPQLIDSFQNKPNHLKKIKRNTL